MNQPKLTPKEIETLEYILLVARRNLHLFPHLDNKAMVTASAKLLMMKTEAKR